MSEDFNHRLDSLEAVARCLVGMLVEQQAMNQRIEGYMQHQDTINDRLTAAIERLDGTLARIDVLLARLIPLC